jgi:small membrane protein
MIAQLFLTALLAIVLIYAWSAYRMAPVVGLLAVAAALAGLYFVWVPAHATALAQFVGVGRGVDLVLYVWVVISLIMLLNLHLKLRAQMELITRLARTSAIAEAEESAREATARPAETAAPRAPEHARVAIDAPRLQPSQADAASSRGVGAES